MSARGILIALLSVEILLNCVSLVCAAPPLKSVKQAEAEQKKRAFYAEGEKKRLFQNDLQEFFAKYMADRYVVQNGIAEKAVLTAYKILQVVDDKTLLMVSGVDGSSPIIIAVRTGSTAGYVDGDRVTMALIADGTYQYANTLGAGRTVAAYKHVNTMTFEEYQAQKAKGVKFAEEPSP